jgi:hypothetical protein
MEVCEHSMIVNLFAIAAIPDQHALCLLLDAREFREFGFGKIRDKRQKISRPLNLRRIEHESKEILEGPVTSTRHDNASRGASRD